MNATSMNEGMGAGNEKRPSYRNSCTGPDCGPGGQRRMRPTGGAIVEALYTAIYYRSSLSDRQMRHLAVVRALFCVAAACVLASPANGAVVTVFAASSLKEALDAQVTHFDAATGHTLTVAYAGSNALA